VRKGIVQLVAIGPSAQLRAQRDELLVLRHAGDEHLTEASMERIVEVLRRQGGKFGDELGVTEHGREQVTFALQARFEQPRRRTVHRASGGTGPSRRQSRERLARKVETVGEKP